MQETRSLERKGLGAHDEPAAHCPQVLPVPLLLAPHMIRSRLSPSGTKEEDSRNGASTRTGQRNGAGAADKAVDAALMQEPALLICHFHLMGRGGSLNQV